MKLVVLTVPDILKNEADAINGMFASGLDILHLRKPNSTAEDISKLIENIDSCYHERITLHDHFELCDRFQIGGLHLNRRNPEVPHGFKGRVSASCHSFDEVTSRKGQCNYVFLSPIFNSISKEGYGSNFTLMELEQASANGIIDESVYALGGIGLEEVKILKKFPFGGAAVLGWIWGDFKYSGNVNAVVSRFNLLAGECSDELID